MRCFIKGIASGVLLVVLLSTSASAGGDDAGAVVRSFQAGLLETMKQAATLGVKGRYDRLKPLISRTFHLPLMIATASSPYWRAGTPKQREKLLAAFRRMSVSTVATLFDSYGGETFHIVRVRPTKGPTALVDTQIIIPEKDPVTITYVAAKLRSRWWIIDIIVDGGISEVRVRRNEYLKLLKEGGLDRLAKMLDQKADRLLSGKETAEARK